MAQIKSFCFPDIPTEISDLLFCDDPKMIIIGVIGKSSFPDCNKLAGFQLLGSYVSLLSDEDAKDGNIKIYFEKGGNILYVHFETTYDSFIMQEILEKSMKNDDFLDDFISFNSYIRNRFARMLLFAIQVCHLIVFVDTGNTFDVSFLSIFKSLKIIREKYVLKFLPNLLKNSNVGGFMGKEGRLCSPRFIFFFEQTIEGYSSGDIEYLNKIEFEMEDDIYKMLRNEFIITNNSCASLFSIPRNKRFVYFNTDKTIREDPLLETMKLLNKFIEKPKDDQEDDQIRPFKGFGKRWSADLKEDTLYQNVKSRSLLGLLKEHVSEALQIGFDDSMAKFRGKSHFVTPSIKSWYETFKILHKIFIENPDNPDFEANDANYKLYLENFQKIMDIDETFFAECCEHGLDTAISHYNEILPHHYSRTLHEEKLIQSIEVLRKYARGSQVIEYENKLKEICENTWLNGKQQCESLSLRGNPCGMPVHTVNDSSEHSSGVVSVSTCNCGRTQGRREDPYTIKQANYEFYQLIANICTLCNKIEKRIFPVFEPSSKDFRAADVVIEKQMSSSQILSEISGKVSDYESVNSQPLEASQPSNLSGSFNESIEDDKLEGSSDDDGDGDDDDEGSVKEIVIKVGETTEKKDKIIARLHSTTEYLPGMVHTSSPIGLLPQFPSWSLVCIGPSSVYSHNTGLPEHVQSGFLSGANFLLPWDVQVRLENSAEWAASYEKSRNRKKPQAVKPPPNPDSVFSLKIFIGTEYECPRGHRFIMSSPDKILRGGSGMVVRDSGSKIVFNDMPLYYNCPCRSSKPSVAQLMRIHVVTPKAPCNVILDPKIRPGGKGSLVFVTGLPQPAKLTQSAYWMLRLPYIYQGDDGPILPPLELTSSNLNMHGCLLAGMYGITETE